MLSALRRLSAVASIALVASCATAEKPSADLVMEEFRVASDPGIEIYVRNKHLAGMNRFSSDKTVLFIHGATYPSETAFDLRLAGTSWMEYIARQGYDVYLLDVRGYGTSTRPAQMDKPPQDNPPFAGAKEAVRDVDAVVDFIRKRRDIQKIDLLGWSWGTAVFQAYTSRHNEKVEKLVLYAPVWIRQTASLVQAGAGPLGAYRSVTMVQAKERWLTGVPEDKKAELIPAGWFDAWAAATLASDPVGSKQTPPVVRAPNGVVEDGVRSRTTGQMDWNPEDIRVPVLLIKAEWDQDTPAYMAQTLFPKLVNAPYKRYVELGEGTHTIVMEKNRMTLFREVQLFLEEKYQRSE
jgi:pimeloyl-ACP methyl ester carboxylesterase